MLLLDRRPWMTNINLALDGVPYTDGVEDPTN